MNGRADMADSHAFTSDGRAPMREGLRGALRADLRHAAKAFSFPRRLDVRMIRPWLPDLAGGRMLDVGCGDGYWTARLARRCRALACGIEVDALAVAAASREHPQHAWRVARAEDLPFPGAAFDLVVSLSCLQFIADAARALREMRRVLRPGGRLILTADAMDWPGISPRFLRLHQRKYRVAAYWPLERLRPAARLPPEIGDQVAQRGLEVIAESAPRRVGPPECAADQPQGELLEQLVGLVRIAQGAEQVAVGGALVTLDQRQEGLLRGRVGAVRAGHQRPHRGDPAQSRLKGVLVHRGVPLCRTGYRLRSHKSTLSLRVSSRRAPVRSHAAESQ